MWKQFLTGSKLVKKKCFRKFYDWVYSDGFCKGDFLKRRKNLKFKSLLKQLYNLYISSDEYDKAKIELYFEIIDNMFADEGDTIENGNGVTTMAKAQLLYFLKQMTFMKFKIWKRLMPELVTPLRPVNQFRPWYANKIWKPWVKTYPGKRKIKTNLYLNRFCMDKTFIQYNTREMFYVYEELEQLEEDLEEEMGIIRQMHSGIGSYTFYKKNKNYVDNFRVKAKQGVEYLNIAELHKVK